MKDTLGVLLAGGAGERLYPLTRDRAKPSRRGITTSLKIRSNGSAFASSSARTALSQTVAAREAANSATLATLSAEARAQATGTRANEIVRRIGGVGFPPLRCPLDECRKRNPGPHLWLCSGFFGSRALRVHGRFFSAHG